MYLGRYAFDGDPTLLEAAYRRLLASYPPDTLELQVAVIRPHGLDVYDACPDEATFASFSASPEFHAALSRAGLPTPRVSDLGQVVNALLKQPVG
jgi:hypothetical protein